MMQHVSLIVRDAIDDGEPNPRGEDLARLSIVFASLAGTFVLLRLATRKFYLHNLGLDDALISAAMVLAVAMAVVYNGEAANGFGLHNQQVDLHHKTIAFKYFFAAQILYKVTVCLTKLSLGALYLRIFPTRRFRIAVYVVMAICVIYSFIAVMLTVFACDPIRKSWDKTLPGKCLQSRDIWSSTSILNIITDAMIIFLPILETRKLNLPLRQKLLLSALFSLGGFVIACTIVRMITVSPETTAADQTYYQAVSNSWTFIETDVGIMCACLPVLRIPISRHFRQVYNKTRTGVSSHQSDVVRTFGQGDSKPQQSSQNDSMEKLVEGKGIQLTTTIKMQSVSEPPDVRYPTERAAEMTPGQVV